jgi:hypothetical protein
MKQTEKIKILSHFLEEKQLRDAAEKRYQEMRKTILENISSGQYGPYTVLIDTKEIEAYEVKNHTRTELKVKKS